jgi:hypothetical protein
MKITEYDILIAQQTEALIKNVNVKIKDGFQPYGSPYRFTDGGQDFTAQAMIREGSFLGNQPSVSH